MIHFNKTEWLYEVSSGFSGYRNIHTKEWITAEEYRTKTLSPAENTLYTEAVKFYAYYKEQYKADALGDEIVYFMTEFAKSNSVRKFITDLQNNEDVIIPLDKDALDFEIEDIYNTQINKREKPPQRGTGQFPNNYKLDIWQCLQVKRLSDNSMFIKDITNTHKGKVLYFKFKQEKENKKICLVGTSLGEFNINELIILEF